MELNFDDIDEEKRGEVAAKMLVHDTVVALAADLKSRDAFYLIKITEEKIEKTENVEDGFGHVMKKGMKHLEKVLLEKKFVSNNPYTIPKRPKPAFF